MYSKYLLALGAGLVAAAPRQQPQEPCARVTQLINHNTTIIPGELAYECLQSMPFEPKRAAAFVEDLKKYMQWHSTADELADPPLGAPVDFWGGLDDLQNQAAQNKFASQFEFDTAINTFLAQVKDGHLAVLGCSSAPLKFVGYETLVSVSKDGIELPEIYTYHDAKFLNTTPNAVSPVVRINGESATAYLENMSESQLFQDADARYNQLFYSNTRFISASTNLGGFSVGPSGAWPGQAEFTLEYKNGTINTSPVHGYVAVDDFKYQNGRELYEDWCLPVPATTASPTSTPTSTPSSPASSSSAVATPTSTVLPPPAGYPAAVVRDSNNLLAGYLPREAELKDTAVMRIPTFSVSETEGASANISDLAVKFIQKAKAEGKEKIILDLSSNPGGNINWAMDLFRLFFPNSMPYVSSRLRAHEALRLIYKVAYAEPTDVSPEAEAMRQETLESPLFGLKTPDQDYTFKTLKEFYGPHTIDGANFTSANWLDLNKMSTTDSPVHGYGGVPNNYTAPPFEAKDILIMTDGACSSSCPLFTQLMSYEGVKTLSFGGRPTPGSMTTMGGTRGSEVFEGSQIVQLAAGALEIGNATGILSPTEVETLMELSPALDSPLSYEALSVNVRNAYSKYDTHSVEPLQFVDTPADCRLFYTAQNIFEPGSAWADAARAIWGGGECVEGSRA
ncbi:hypothetical protein BDV18DRAFT_161736 [Aspergillus unguis]